MSLTRNGYILLNLQADLERCLGICIFYGITCNGYIYCLPCSVIRLTLNVGCGVCKVCSHGYGFVWGYILTRPIPTLSAVFPDTKDTTRKIVLLQFDVPFKRREKSINYHSRNGPCILKKNRTKISFSKDVIHSKQHRT